jgi:pyridoxal phosphate enzyme (YggS family)
MTREKYHQLLDSLGKNVTLVAVSKMQTVESIRHLYSLGQRDFGENYVQELMEKHLLLPKDIRWHFIGHLQSNKIKYIAPFIHLIQGVDSVKLLMEIDRQGKKLNKVIDCLLQVHISGEETKFGLNEIELDELADGLIKAEKKPELNNIKIVGLMGMASFSEDMDKVRAEFKLLSALYDKYLPVKYPHFNFQRLSMGMSADYKAAIEEGSNMVRIGSLLFGHRNQI